jgi:cytochrome P450
VLLDEINLTDGAFWSLPLAERHAAFATLRRESPMPVFEIPEVPGFIAAGEQYRAVTRYADIVEMSRQPEIFCSGLGSTALVDMPADMAEFFGSFINMDDPKHARLRGIVSRRFTPRQLQAVLDNVAATADEIIDGICEKGEVDLVETVSQPFPLLIICDMMGIPRSEFKTVLDATNIILGAGDPDFSGDDPLASLVGAALSLTGLMTELAEAKRKDPGDDLTSALVTAAVDEEMLTPQELGSFFILLAVAGNDTTRTAISHGMHDLTNNPAQRKIWQDDIEGVTGTAVEEIVRYATPVVFMRRTTTRPTTLGGFDLDKGERLVMFYGSANRDESVFANPDTFDLRRNPNPHIGFGGPGPHFCLGAHLARREVGVMFSKLLTRLPDIQATADPVLLQSQSVPLVTGVKKLPVTFTPASKSGS